MHGRAEIKIEETINPTKIPQIHWERAPTTTITRCSINVLMRFVIILFSCIDDPGHERMDGFGVLVGSRVTTLTKASQKRRAEEKEKKKRRKEESNQASKQASKQVSKQASKQGRTNYITEYIVESGLSRKKNTFFTRSAK